MRSKSLVGILVVSALGLGVWGCGDARSGRPSDGSAKDRSSEGGTAGACSDGIDNDGDGKTDYPAEPGCDDPNDDDEADPATPPECSNGKDDDGDGKTDYPADPGCSYAAGRDESRDPRKDACGAGVDAIDITKITSATADIPPMSAGTLAGSCGGEGNGEKVFLYRIPSGKHDLVFSTVDSMVGNPADTVLYVRRNCTDPSTEIACGDDFSAATKQSQIYVKNAEPGDYYVIVDSKGGTGGTVHVQVASYLSRGEPCETGGDGGTPTEVCEKTYMCRAPAGGGPTVCTAPQCADEVDNDGDGKTDFPFDPGCDKITDDDEKDPATVPACGNGVDDDKDGKTDYPADPGCTSAADKDERDECYPGVPINPLDTSGAMGDTSGVNKTTGTCSTAAGPEVIYRFHADADYAGIVFSTDVPETTGDTVLYVRKDDCMGTEVACNNDVSSGNPRSRVEVTDVKAGTDYFVFVDGATTVTAKYKLVVQVTLAEGASCDAASTTVICSGNLICKGPAGSAVCAVPKCDNGKDDDADGKTDYPTEPGCTSPKDDDEVDECPGAGCPQCGNGKDDDGDGKTDYPSDPGCTSAADGVEIDACTTGVDVLSLPDEGVTDSLPMMMSGALMGSCVAFYPASYPEKVYAYTLTRSLRSLRFSTNNAGTPTLDTMIYARYGVCSDSTAEVGCNDDVKPGTYSSQLTLVDPKAGTYFVVVDSKPWPFTGAIGGSFKLTVGGVIATGDPCDTSVPTFTCEVGSACRAEGSGMPERCLPAICGNGEDDDMDGLTDYPADPGCSSLSDDDETDPVSPPACDDGIDNDGDGFTDYPNDVGCGAKSDVDEANVCASGVSVNVLPAAGDSFTFAATTVSTPFSAPCNGSGASSYMPERIYQFGVDRDYRWLRFSTDHPETTYDTVLYSRYGDCTNPDAVEACNDNLTVSNTRSTITLTEPLPGPHYIFVDGGTYTGFWAYKLTVEGSIGLGSRCDPASTNLVCEPGTFCKDSVCTASKCANGVDDDMDGKTDFPDDPGCTDIKDEDETDPVSPPACDDGIDNDMDGKTDFPDDLGCGGAGDVDEADLCAPGVPFKGALALGDMTATLPTGEGALTSKCSSAKSGEDVWVFRVDRHYQSLKFDTALGGTLIDTVLYLRENECSDTSAELYCEDDTVGVKARVDVMTPVYGATYYVVVDGKGTGGGLYELRASGVVGSGEACDPDSAYETCEAGTSCTGTSGSETCQ